MTKDVIPFRNDKIRAILKWWPEVAWDAGIPREMLFRTNVDFVRTCPACKVETELGYNFALPTFCLAVPNGQYTCLWLYFGIGNIVGDKVSESLKPYREWIELAEMSGQKVAVANTVKDCENAILTYLSATNTTNRV